MTLLIVVVVIGVVAALSVALAARIMLGRHNRVVSGVRSPTPIAWLVSSRREARIHRRLRAAGRRLELVPATAGVADVITRLRVELVELDGYLVTVARRPSRTRRADRKVVYERLGEVEALVHRIEERSRNESVSLGELSERLDALEAADEELRELGPG